MCYSYFCQPMRNAWYAKRSLLRPLMAQTFGEWIKNTRKTRGWTIQQCARRAGLRWQSWARLEHDEPRSQSGKPPQRQHNTAVAVAKGLNVGATEAFAAAGLGNPVSAKEKALFEADTTLFEAIIQLDHLDQMALQALVAHLITRKSVPAEPPLPVVIPEPSPSLGPRTIGIDLDSGSLRDHEGKILSEAQLRNLAEWMGQLAALYARSHYTLSEANGVLAQMRQELGLFDLAPEDPEESALYTSDAKT